MTDTSSARHPEPGPTWTGVPNALWAARNPVP